MRRYNRFFGNNDPYERARYRVEKIRSFYVHLLVYSIFLVVYILRNYFKVSFHFLGFHFINSFMMSIWTLIIIIKAIQLFIREVAFGTQWEQEKVEKIMNQNQQNQKWE